MSTLKPLGNTPVARVLAAIYGTVIAIRNHYYTNIPGVSRPLNRYTIVVGGIHAGGTGKTPLCIMVAKELIARRMTVALLSRGYGRTNLATIIAPPFAPVSWHDTGDEPALFHHTNPQSWLGIGANRRRTATLLDTRLPGKAVYILDDGFQHRAVRPHKSIICLPVDTFDSRLIPSGYLREPVRSLSRADILCLIGQEDESTALTELKRRLEIQFPHTPAFILVHRFDGWIDGVTGRKIGCVPFVSPLVLSGIARPERFHAMIQKIGIKNCKFVCYSDHHIFHEDEIQRHRDENIDGIITTEKDFIRLSTINLVKQTNICYLKTRLCFVTKEESDTFFNLLTGEL